MSQTQPAAPQSTARLALVLGIIGLILGASGLGYAVYLGASQLPSQLSAVSVKQNVTTRAVRVDWFNTDPTGLDRFFPMFITVNQGDNVSIIFSTNDTTDGHTFTTSLAFRGITSGVFQLNNSFKGLTSGPYIKPFHPSAGGIDCCFNGGTYNPEANFTGKPTTCSDQNGASVTCNTQQGASKPGATITACNAYVTGTACNLWSTGFFIVTVPGVYEFHCFYHRSVGMFGYLTVLPNTAYTPS